MRSSDWSSDVCSSDLAPGGVVAAALRLSHLSIGEDPDNLCGRAICGSGHGRDCADLSRPWPLPRWILGQIDRVASAGDTLVARRAGANTATWPSSHSRSEEHTSELQSLMRISYAVFCLKKKNK